MPLPAAAVLAAVLLAAMLLPAPGEAAPPPLLDQPAPAFRLRGIDGSTLSLENLRGKFIVLHFGASW
jgi:cytochrome c biogenesis protein CcmG/thiol:disulfide interchange protein DsbE